ncbi:hypothetical protein GIB67_025042 [Kingdonia uniflora]|uniref:Peptidyl-prolyl cis-trans isomerase CYP38-like PsbQ-like domain-containing protein n=1 Tax=Kingdonia uniflora TaxID=39325 RepID=A0A7J7N8F7_9MAGN|nr:hypothetical protein GIB67_025042 [Kingdonia uniflora]
MSDYAVGIIEITFTNTYSTIPHEYLGLSGCRFGIPISRSLSFASFEALSIVIHYDIPSTLEFLERVKLLLRRSTTNLESSETYSDPLTLLVSTFSYGIKSLETAFAVVLIFVQISSPLPFLELNPSMISPARAVLYSPDTKVPRTGELALRRAIPANTNMKAIQDSLEDISYFLRIPQRKPYGSMEGNVKKVLKIAKDEKESILGSIPTNLQEKASFLYVSLLDGKGGLQSLLESIKDKDPDKVSVYLASSLDTVAELELLQAPGLSFLLPKQYLTYPRYDFSLYIQQNILFIVLVL